MTASLRGQLARSTEKRGGAGQRNVVENGEVEVAFIGLERRGGGRSEELDGGRGVRFEVSRFEDEGDTVRHRFIGQKEGGRAALWFSSPCMEGDAAAPARAVVARALSDEGDDPGLTERVGPPISEREATAESDKWSRRRADWAGQGGRRWAATGLEKKRGGRAETISRAEIK
jgi:hypothetical protein